MKVALIGEFSSLHKYLKEGLLELGNEVVLISSGDGYKRIGGADLTLPQITNGRSISQRIDYSRRIRKLAVQLREYDVVQLIYTNVVSPLNNTYLAKALKKNNQVLSLEAAGNDYAYLRAFQTGEYEHHLFNYFQPPLYGNTIKGYMEKKTASQVEELCDIIIPAMYDYTLGYQTPKLHDIIPLPINCGSIQYRENTPGEKLVFFHGLNNEKKKGTPLIRAALERLQERYPNDVEVIIDGHMPFDRYLELMQRVNVVIDQTFGYAYGVNSCIALAMGKAVVTSCKQVAIDAMGAAYNPFISILPDTDDIFEKLCGVLENRKQITEMGHQGRKFVETYHDHVMIAQKYMHAWQSVMQ